MRPVRVFGAFLICGSLGGCCLRALTDQDARGTYEANADWGKSNLILHPDHSFDQTVVRNDGTRASIKGTWRLDLFAGQSASHGILVLKPFLDVEHDHKGDPVGGAVPSISRDLLWGITIAADPDYGISFQKQ
jgi:hypothetical protein